MPRHAARPRFPMKILSFDLDGTLVNTRFTTAVWEQAVPHLYAQKRGLSFDQAKAEVMAEYCAVGEHAIEWYDIKFWLSRLGLDIDWRTLLSASKTEIEAYPEVNAVVERLGKAHRMVVLTNAGREFADMELEVSGLDKHFVQVFSATSDLGMVKKDASFYYRVCRLLKLAPGELTHVGDHLDFDYRAADSAGTRAFFLDRTGEHQGAHVLRSLDELPERLGSP
ncbi:MAG: HAD family hydrolase [Dehalococcoidia bacterium]|nr:HAD family hydrolase [Dehalococcoidia bacterium]